MVRQTGITVDPRRAEPLYRQIFDQIAGRIRSGAYPTGYRLPPTRALASDLGAHRNTVVRAYEDLESAGFVTSSVGRGTYVTAPPPRAAGGAPAGHGSLPWGSLLSGSSVAEPLGRFDRLARSPQPADAINLNKLQPSPDLLPDDLLRRAMDHVLRTVSARALSYGPREGLLRLRELIAEDLARQGVPARAEDIIVTTGSQQGIDLVARALVNPGDVFLTDALTYSGAISVLAAAGARVIGVPGDDEGPSLLALSRLARAGAKGFYLMPNCNNPTALTISPRRREELVAWSHAACVPLIEDDYGADLNLDGQPMPAALRSLDGDVVYLGTFSKKLIPALRLGFMICPPALRAAITSLKHAADLGTSLLLQHALAEFMERGYLRAHLGRILPEYRQRRDALDAGLAAHLPKGLSWSRPSKGEIIWLPLPPSLDPERVHEEARRRGVLVGPSGLYAVEPHAPAGVRLTFCAEPPERLREGARRLGKALASLMVQSREPMAKQAAGLELV